MKDFPQLLRQWRGHRRLSQLALAQEAEVSSRHISFLETGRSQPSREMVLHLAEVLDLPRASRNEILVSAGFANLYPSHDLDDASLAPVRMALKQVMDRHSPFPAVIMDKTWTLVELNPVAAMLFGMSGLQQGDSALAVVDLPGGPTSVIANWAEVGHHMLCRLKAESRAGGGIDVLDRAAARLMKDPIVAGFVPQGPLPPVIPTTYRANGMELSLFSSFMQLGSAEDIALRDLRVELMFPMDEPSKILLEQLGTSLSS